MSRGIRKTGIFIAVMLTVVVLTGCQIAKKDESGQAKEELYGAYAVVGDRIPDGKIAGVKDKKGFEDEIKWIGNFQHYKNKIYLVIGGSDIYELEENNKIKRIVEGAVQSCFYKGSLYYKNLLNF